MCAGCPDVSMRDILWQYRSRCFETSHIHLDSTRARDAPNNLVFAQSPERFLSYICSNNPTERHAVRYSVPTGSASSPTAMRSAASSARSRQDRTTNGPKEAAISAAASSPRAASLLSMMVGTRWPTNSHSSSARPANRRIDLHHHPGVDRDLSLHIPGGVVWRVLSRIRLWV